MGHGPMEYDSNINILCKLLVDLAQYKNNLIIFKKRGNAGRNWVYSQSNKEACSSLGPAWKNC